MLHKLKSLFANKAPKEEPKIEKLFVGPPVPEISNNPNFITEPRTIIDIIRSITAIPLVCSIPSTPEDDVYISKIIELQVEKNKLLLKPLYPEHGNNELQQQKKLKLTTHLNGIHMSISLHEVTAHKIQNSLYYSANLPERIFYPQRRKIARFHTSEQSITFYGISERTGSTVCGKVINLSRRGCAIITNNASARARIGEDLTDCMLNIGHHTRIYFDFKIRHISPPSDSLVILGGTFPYVESMQQQFSLDEFLAKLEAEENQATEETE